MVQNSQGGQGRDVGSFLAHNTNMKDDHLHHRRTTARDEPRRRAIKDRRAIAEGLAQMEADLGKPAEEAFREIQERLGFDRPH